MYKSTIAIWAAAKLDIAARSRALRELPVYLQVSGATVSNHWHGRAKVRQQSADKYLEYFKKQGFDLSFDDLFTPVPIPEHA